MTGRLCCFMCRWKKEKLSARDISCGNYAKEWYTYIALAGEAAKCYRHLRI